MNTHTRRLVVVIAGMVLGAMVPAAASADSGRANACNGLFEVARFATFQQVGETHGHETVHHQFEAHGCVEHHD